MKLTDIIGVLSVLAFLMSLTTWIFTWITQSRRVIIIANEYTVDDNNILINVLIGSKSRLPLSITGIRLSFDDKNLECRRIPHMIFERSRFRGSETFDREVIKDMGLPIGLAPLGATSGYLCFGLPPAFSPQSPIQATFEIQTTHGRPLKTKRILSEVPPSTKM
jgi:hypothetical protein